MKTKRISFTERSKSDEIIIDFPGGRVEVARCSDGSFWAHIDRNLHSSTGEPDAQVLGLRIDCESKNTKDANLGDLTASDFYHVAVRLAEVKS